jgi:hypothetical protein
MTSVTIMIAILNGDSSIIVEDSRYETETKIVKIQKKSWLIIGRRLAIHCRRTEQPRVRGGLRDASQSLYVAAATRTGGQAYAPLGANLKKLDQRSYKSSLG